MLYQMLVCVAGPEEGEANDEAVAEYLTNVTRCVETSLNAAGLSHVSEIVNVETGTVVRSKMSPLHDSKPGVSLIAQGRRVH